jgi:hypothetical protein
MRDFLLIRFPRVPRRAATRPHRSTRGYIPWPRWGRNDIHWPELGVTHRYSLRQHGTDLLRIIVRHPHYAARWMLANQSRMSSVEQQALKVTICPTNNDSLHE